MKKNMVVLGIVQHKAQDITQKVRVIGKKIYKKVQIVCFNQSKPELLRVPAFFLSSTKKHTGQSTNGGINAVEA